MTVRQWYLGMAVAAAAFIPLSANAVTTASVPDLLDGGSFADTPAPPDTLMSAKFTGVTAETGFVGINETTGGSCILGACFETTWGVGNLTSVSQDGGPQSWTTGDKSGGPTPANVSFVIYGIADSSVSFSSSSPGQTTETVKNTGATVSGFGATDGLIHLDLYYTNFSDQPCFTTAVACAANPTKQITSSDRLGNIGTTAAVHGITDVGLLFASFTFQPGTDADATITMSQAVTFQDSTGKTTSSGNQANFYAQCDTSATPGPGCSQFQPVAEDTFAAGSFFGSLITQIFGNIGVATAPGASVFHPANLPSDPGPDDPGCPTAICANSIGWLFSTNDPVRFISSVPEPASLGILGTALAFFGVAVNRRRRKGGSA
jgi:hypothetical protein